MKIHETSRRQDLLVGSIVPIAIMCAAVWLDQGHKLQALPTNRANPPQPIPFIIPPDPVEADDVTDQVKTPVQVEAVAQIPDTPQPITERAFVQPIEPPPPEGHSIATKVPDVWASKRPTVEVFNSDMLDQQPVATHQAKPVYPYPMRERGLSGVVLVDFIVDTNGDVRNVTAVKSTSPEFEASAISAVSKWKFKPGRKASHTVFAHMQVPIEFTLENSNQ
jgi:protein TonB